MFLSHALHLWFKWYGCIVLGYHMPVMNNSLNRYIATELMIYCQVYIWILMITLHCMENVYIFSPLSLSSYAQTQSQMMESPVSVFMELLSSLPSSFPSRSNQSNETAEDQGPAWVTLTIQNTRISNLAISHLTGGFQFTSFVVKVRHL